MVSLWTVVKGWMAPRRPGIKGSDIVLMMEKEKLFYLYIITIPALRNQEEKNKEIIKGRKMIGDQEVLRLSNNNEIAFGGIYLSNVS